MAIKRFEIKGVGRYPVIGKLRKGSKKRVGKNGKEVMGKELKYWRFTSEDPFIEAAFLASFGKTPETISVFLPYQKADDNWSEWQEKWVGSGLVHRCDGENTVLYLDSNGTMIDGSIPCDGGCKEVGRLSVVIPALTMQGFIGTITMETHSINDIINLKNSLFAYESMRGDLRGIEYNLSRIKRNISTPGFGGNKGKRSRVDKYLVQLTPNADFMVAQMQATAAMVTADPLAITATNTHSTPELFAPPKETNTEVDDVEYESVDDLLDKVEIPTIGKERGKELLLALNNHFPETKTEKEILSIWEKDAGYKVDNHKSFADLTETHARQLFAFVKNAAKKDDSNKFTMLKADLVNMAISDYADRWEKKKNGEVVEKRVWNSMTKFEKDFKQKLGIKTVDREHYKAFYNEWESKVKAKPVIKPDTQKLNVAPIEEQQGLDIDEL